MTESPIVQKTDLNGKPNGETQPVPLKRTSDDDLYRHSTQYRVWSFTKESLRKKRDTLSAENEEKFKSKVSEFLANEQNELSQDEIKAFQDEMVAVTSEESLNIVTLYASKLQMFGTKLKLPTEVTSSAVIFFKKFYLENSVLSIHPKNIIFTCMFLACKSENYFINIESFAKKVKQPKDSILEYEFKLLESLKFTLYIHHPFKSLHGFFLDIQSILYGKVDVNYLGTVYENTKKKIIDSILTDVNYYYTPPQITLAALLKEDEQLTLKYLELKLLGFDSSKEGLSDVELKKKEQYDKILDTVKQCLKDMQESFIPSKNDAWKIDARIHYYSDPMAFVKRLRKQKEIEQEVSVKAEPDSEEPPIKKQKI